LTVLEAKAAASTAKQAKAEGSLAKLVSCVPELQTEVGDLEIAGETYSVAHLKNGTNISKGCTSILYGLDHAHLQNHGANDPQRSSRC
jgi:hypothetical protein